PGEGLKGCQGLLEEDPRARVLEVEVVRRLRVNELAGQRRLPALTGPRKHHDRSPPQGGAEGFRQARPSEEHAPHYHENLTSEFRISWWMRSQRQALPGLSHRWPRPPLQLELMASPSALNAKNRLT